MSVRATAKTTVENAAETPVKARRTAAPTGARSALDLQRDVAEAAAAGAFDHAAQAVESDRWSQRRTLGFIVVTCSAFWIGVGLLIAHSR
jgi:hypothetical protein